MGQDGKNTVEIVFLIRNMGACVQGGEGNRISPELRSEDQWPYRNRWC